MYLTNVSVGAEGAPYPIILTSVQDIQSIQAALVVLLICLPPLPRALLMLAGYILGQEK